ncbi:hypothetical protein BH11BAC5_BH11BAC5_13250 [soil metagenome]
MKHISLLIFWLFSTAVSNANSYYVSASGDDSNDGLTINTPWQSLAKINQSSFAAGDVILLKRGDVFYGSVVVNRNDVSFDAYGTGALPIISGFTQLSSWVDAGNGIWKANVSGASSALKIILIDGVQQRKGRYPNYNDSDGGWLSYESFDGSNSSITDEQLSTSPYNWTGATLAMKAYSYVINLCPVTAHNGGTLNYNKAVGTLGIVNSPGMAGYGYFVTDDLHTLDSFGEWFLDKDTKDLYVYFGSNDPSTYNVQASNTNVLLDCGVAGYMGGTATKAYSNISISNIAFEGANSAAVNAFNGSNITVSQCTINNCYNGIFMWNITNSITIGNTITNIQNNAIQQLGLSSSSLTTIKNNTIRHVGLFEGMGDSGEGNTYGGINQDGDNAIISGNRIDSVGFNGIHWQGSNVVVESNFVNHHNMKLDDGGGIYTYAEKTKVNRIVRNNIVLNGIGNRQGRTENDARTWGIYNDGSTNNVVYLNNTVSIEDGGGLLNNSGQNIVVTGNTFFEVPVSVYVARFPNTSDNPGQLVRYNRMTQNISYPSVSNFFYWNGQLNDPVTIDIQADIQAIDTWDSNYYRNDLNASFDWYYHLTPGGTFVDPPAANFTQWQSYINGDAHSVVLSTAPHVFQYNATNNPVVYNFAGQSKKDAQGNIYNNSATIPAWGSKLLFDNGAAVSNNIPPVANAGADKSITLPVNTLTLSGSGTDADGSISSYAWAKIAGPTGGTIVSSNAASTALNSLVQGTYNFVLTVTDNKGAAAKDTVKVVVNLSTAIAITTNKAPVVNAGTDKTVTLPANTVTLTGTATDADGAVSSYLWTKISGPAGGTIATANAPTTSVSNLVQGTYNYELVVTDNKGAKSKDSLKIVVSTSSINRAPVANAGADKAITLPVNTVTLKGSGTDADGTIASYAWPTISVPACITIATSNASSTVLNNLVKGVYNFALIVTDNKGAASKDSVKVIVNAAAVSTPVANKAPVANAGGDKTITLPVNTVTLKGGGTDADGTIASYAWTKISGPAGVTIATSNASSTVLNNLVKGVYNFALIVTDNKGALAKDSVKVTVNAAAVSTPVANKAPVANAGGDKTITLPVNSVTLTGSATDADGTISSYEWVKISGATGGTIGTANTSTTAITSLSKGIYKYALIVKDNNGFTGRDTVQITVNAALQHTLSANAGANKTITLPIDSVTLVASVAVVNAIVTSYSWGQIEGPSATIADGNAAISLVKNLSKGDYTFELTVKDNAGGIAKDTISITVLEDPFLHRGSSLNVYPNPVKNIANLDIKTAAKDGTKIMVSVINSSGNLMSRKQFVSAGNNPVLKLDMSDLLDGFYIVNVVIENEQPLNAKVIKAGR